MTRCSAALALALVTSSCGGGSLTLVASDLPSSASFVAIVATSESGEVVASSGLVRWSGAGALDIELAAGADGEAAKVRVLSWSAGAISRARIPPDTDLSSPLRAATPEEPLIPAPDAVHGGAVEGSSVHLEAGALDGLELTAPWVPACPGAFTSTETVHFWTTCLPVDCRPPIEHQGCRVTIRHDLCGGRMIEAKIGPRGGFEVPEAFFGTCARAEPRPGARHSADCTGTGAGGCKVDLLAPPYAPHLEVARAKVVARAPVLQNGISSPTGGLLGGLVILPDRAVVASYDGLDANWQCEVRDQGPGQTAPVPTRVHFLDLETLAQIGTATLPPCLTWMTRDPRGDGWLGALSGKTPALARFDRAGRLVAQRAIEAAEVKGRLAPVAIAVDAPQREVVVLFRQSYGNGPDAPGRALRFDIADLRPLGVSAPLDEAMTGAVPLPDGTFLALGNDDDQLQVFDPRSGNVTNAYPLTVTCPIRDFYAGQVAFGTTTPSFLVSSLGGSGSVLALSNAFGERCVASPFYERDAQPYGLIEWPANPALVLVGLTVKDPTRTALAALLDPQEARYVPGALPIGQGPVATPTSDARGRIWVTLPWEGAVARISERR